MTPSTGISRIRRRLRRFGLLALLGTLTAGSAGVTAQEQQQPMPLPNQRSVDRVLNPALPQYENPLDKRINEGLKSLGLPPQPTYDANGREQEAPAAAPGLSETVLPRLDSNRDGAVSRDEYFDGRQRNTVAGDRGTQRALERYRRFDSRFRAADSNRDGKLTGAEIDAMKGRRF